MTPLTRDAEFIASVRREAEVGHTIAQASRALRVKYQTVARVAQVNSIAFAQDTRGAPKRGPNAKHRRMRDLYQSGRTLQQIGDEYGVTRERVRQILAKHFGLSAADGGQAKIAARARAERLAQRDADSMARRGCTVAQYRSLLAIGRKMRESGCGPEQTPTRAFSCQRANAAARGIGWEMNLWQWWCIWRDSGKWEQRGRGNGYVMCRKGDKGPYSVSNVFIASSRQNNSDGNKKSSLPMGVQERNGAFTSRLKNGADWINLGSFDCPDAAHLAYLEKIEELGLVV